MSLTIVRTQITARIEGMTYLQAFRETRKRGYQLPSNILHDEILVRQWPRISQSPELVAELQKYYPAWAREILVYPEKGGVFKRDRDVIDTAWAFPASYLPLEVLDLPNIGLFVDPAGFKEIKGRIFVEPYSVVVLDNFLQESGCGKVDECTGIPLAVSKEEMRQLLGEQRRYFWRIQGLGVRPLVRYVYDIYVRRVVIADDGHDYAYGVALFDAEEISNRVIQT